MNTYKAVVSVGEGHRQLLVNVTVQADNWFAASMMLKHLYGEHSVKSAVLPA
jgi:hypothetical protein